MNTENLSSAIEHLELAGEFLFIRRMSGTTTDDVCHNAYMSIQFHLKLLKNDLHYAEIDQLAKWKERIK